MTHIITRTGDRAASIKKLIFKKLTHEKMGRFSSQDKHMTIVIYAWLISYGMIYDTVEPSLSIHTLTPV